MVFCKECRQNVEDCSHFVVPIPGERIPVFDAKVVSLAYDPQERILEIAFKSGQVWQLLGIPAGIYQELKESTISSFLKFIAQRYKAAPVRTKKLLEIPAAEVCPNCGGGMIPEHKTGDGTATFVRVRWHCTNCTRSEWRSYGVSDRRERRRH